MVRINLKKNPPGINLDKPTDPPGIPGINPQKPTNPPGLPGLPTIPTFNEPQESLEPILPGIYMTPDNPADPRDCDRYPDSPYCGGMPFTNNFIPKIEPSIVKDDCNIGIQVDPSFAFVKLPPVQIVHRYCQLPEKKEPPIQLENYENPVFVPDGDGYGMLFRTYNFSHEDGFAKYAKDEQTQSIIECKISINREILGYVDGQPYIAFCKFRFRAYYKRNSSWMQRFRFDGRTWETADEDYKAIGWKVPANHKDNPNGIWEKTVEGEVSVYFIEFQGSDDVVVKCDNPDARGTLFGDYLIPFIAPLESIRNSDIKNTQKFARHLYSHEFYATLEHTEVISDFQPRQLKKVKKDISNWDGSYAYTYRGYEDNSIEVERTSYQVIPANFQPPPPPPPPHCCKNMACCPDTSNLEALLKLILKKIGANDLPATVPKVLTNPGKGTTKIQNLAEFTAYSVKQMDALCGKYPVEIEIEDADLTKEGNQKEKVKLPNIAEALAEIMGLLLIIRTESDATLSATVRGLIETGSTKQIALLAHDYAKANAEYLAYKGKQVEREIPFTFKPDEKQLDKMLKEEKVKVKGWENDDKQDIKDDLAPLLELAAMWKAANFKQVGSGEDSLEKLKSILKNGGDFKEIMKKAFKDAEPKKEPEQEPEKKAHPEWNEFLEEAEQGFISRPGITDVTKPYHRPMKQRPKIKEISKKEPENPPGPSTGG